MTGTTVPRLGQATKSEPPKREVTQVFVVTGVCATAKLLPGI